MKINWKVRLKNPIFWVQVAMAGLLTALGYNQMNPQDLTTWQGVFSLFVGVLKNPYLLCSVAWSVYCAINDPTTKGVSDSERALTYTQPNS